MRKKIQSIKSGNKNLSHRVDRALDPIEKVLIVAQIKEKVQGERIREMQAIAANVAHELRTPLLSIDNACGIENFIPRLVEAYHLAKAARLPVQEIQSRHLAVLSDRLKSISIEARSALKVVSNFLTHVKKLLGADLERLTVCSMGEMVDEALERYPLTPLQRKLIHWDHKNDFQFKGNEWVIHVLFDLLKNAFDSIAQAGQGEIFIRLKKNKVTNELHFKETGKGGARDKQPLVLPRTEHDTGMGLAFCKVVMQNMGGDMTFKSAEGKETEFVLCFPVLKKGRQV
jgi:signal transduction histidine kinase